MTSTTTTPPIRLAKLSHMRYRHADIEATHNFLLDFGMTLAHKDGKFRYYAGQGPDPYVYIAEESDRSEFRGGTYLVESKEDLERASEMIPGASKVLDNGGPAGGYLVTIPDPDGIPVNLVWGLDAKPVADDKIPPVNYPVTKPRKGEFRRFKQEPCPVFKLGHYGLLVSNFERTYEFYTKWFNLKATDILTAPNGMRVAAFMHVDIKGKWVDHHTFFFSQNSKKIGPHHCSFEVNDPDIQAIGHDWLKSKGYKASWGVGRHILGSQVFDYWYMPDDFMIEHYSDGDLVDDTYETSYMDASDEALAIWGPAVPVGFMDAIPDDQLPNNTQQEVVAVA